MWVYGSSLWGTIQSYHHREAVLWKAEGCFWTSRFMEITDQSSDWQATDCMSLSGSWLMGADGFWLSWRIALQDACMLTAWCQVQLMHFNSIVLFLFCTFTPRCAPYETVTCHLSKMFFSDVPLWESAQEKPQFNLDHLRLR